LGLILTAFGLKDPLNPERSSGRLEKYLPKSKMPHKTS
jgi:hypothetical protein